MALVDATPEEETLLAEAEGTIGSLAELPAVPGHGDLWSRDVLRLGVIDRDLSHFESPTEVLGHFVASTGPRIQTEDSMARALFGGYPATKAGASAERRALDERGLGPDVSCPLFTIFPATRSTRPRSDAHARRRRLAARWPARGRPAAVSPAAS